MTEFNLALLIVRVWIGLVIIAHGIKHVRGREKTTNWLRSMGYQQPELNWVGMSFGELAVGAAIAVGLLTSFAAAGYIAIMVVAYLTVHRKAGFWITARPDEGYEYVATLAAASIAVAMLGPGEWAIDEAIGIAENLDGWAGLIIGVAGAAAGALQVAAFFRPTSVQTAD